MPSDKDINRLKAEVGEIIVGYELMKRGCEVMKNLGGHGYDLLATKGRVDRKIEVKIADPKTKKGKWKNQLTAIISQSEKEVANFLIYYIHGHDTYFIIPKRAFPESRSVTVNIGKDGKIASGTVYEKWRNKWGELE